MKYLKSLLFLNLQIDWFTIKLEFSLEFGGMSMEFHTISPCFLKYLYFVLNILLIIITVDYDLSLGFSRLLNEWN